MKCKDEDLNAKLYNNRASAHYHLGKYHIPIYTDCQHCIKFRIQHAILYSVSQPFFEETLLGSLCNCRKIPKISPRAYIFQRPVLRGLSMKGICVSKSIGLAL